MNKQLKDFLVNNLLWMSLITLVLVLCTCIFLWIFIIHGKPSLTDPCFEHAKIDKTRKFTMTVGVFPNGDTQCTVFQTPVGGVLAGKEWIQGPYTWRS